MRLQPTPHFYGFRRNKCISPPSAGGSAAGAPGPGALLGAVTRGSCGFGSPRPRTPPSPLFLPGPRGEEGEACWREAQAGMLGPLLRSGTKAGGAASLLRAFGGEGRLGNGTHPLRGRGQRDEGTCQVPAGRRGPHPPPPTGAPGPQAVGLQCCFQHQEHASLRFLPRPLNYKSRAGWSCPERRLLLKRAPGVAWASASSSSPGAALPPPALPLLPGEGPARSWGRQAREDTGHQS